MSTDERLDRIEAELARLKQTQIRFIAGLAVTVEMSTDPAPPVGAPRLRSVDRPE